MKIQALFLFVFIAVGGQQAIAHENHNHGPISEPEVIEIGALVAADLSTQDAGLGFGQLPESWASVPNKSISLYKKGAGYYIVAVFNESEKKTLYVLMSQGGDAYDANFTGIFEGIEQAE